MNKNRVRLTEAQLHRVIRESVAQVIRENKEDEDKIDYALGVANKVGKDVKDLGNRFGKWFNRKAEKGTKAVTQGVKDVAQGAKNVYDTVQSGVTQGVQAVNNYANNVKKAGMQAADAGEVKSAIKTINKLMQSELINQNLGKQAIQSMNKALRGKQY